MIRIANDFDFNPVDQNGQDILTRKTNAANASIKVVEKAMEIVGGQGFYLKDYSEMCRLQNIICSRTKNSFDFRVIIF